MSAKLPPGTLDKLWSDSNNWRGGVIYVCKEDPRIVVPKRPKWGGWTLNFAHGSAWLVLSNVMFSILLPVILFLLGRPLGIVLGLISEAAIITSWCGLSAVFSSPRRYESAG